ncbi:hypothetical protein AVEN_266444-1 [Araneus ventricosus]|uniref:Carboxylic ester hydrolase n=1 Tax=Araneus ventricosus TaxID=182803 RepID=A0A4Y2G905_ARAVE|nr:hypothetical protein AVEN_266444-1 [Araneus ventricosus]
MALQACPHDLTSVKTAYIEYLGNSLTQVHRIRTSFLLYHGGGFFTGSIRQPIYDGRALAGLGDETLRTSCGLSAFYSLFTLQLNGRDDDQGDYKLGFLARIPLISNLDFTSKPELILEKDLAPGVWDTLEALKWVNNHIENFGGDKDSITLAGESSGAVIVSLFSKTPYAIGLYKRQIVQSATAMWTLMDDELAVFQRSGTVSEKVGCVSETFKLLHHPDEVVECMRRKNFSYNAYQ